MPKQQSNDSRPPFIPPPGADTGGLENIPDEMLPESEQVKQELNQAGLNTTLPGEEAAPAEAAEERVEYPAEEPKAEVDE
jgi:hypothetical protein